MSAPDLPDDPRHWPTDPFALLGVERGAGETDIKRAYTRLIRRFKPEHAPEQFRRIREAYETCLDQGRWFFPPPNVPPPDFPPPVATPPRPPRPAPAPSADDAPADLPPPEPVPSLAPPPDEVEQLWAAAADGRDGDAYAGLAALAAARPDRPDLPLRLYWLLATNPALDPGRTRHDWLADALARTNLSGPAAELYRRELEINPDAALYGPYLRLLSAPAHHRDLLTVARWRLTAAGRSRSWHPVVTDLEVLAAQLPYHDEPAWLGFVVAVWDWAAWDRPHPLVPLARRELDRLRHLELGHSYAFDRVEETDRLAAEWKEVQNTGLPPDLLRLIPIAWAGAGEVSPADIAPAVAAVATDPSGNLYRFDRFLRERGPGQLMYLRRVLNRLYQYRDGSETEFPPELIRGLAAGLFGGWRRDYNAMRSDLLNFLVTEAIHPEEFAAACRASPNFHIREAADPLSEDVTIHLVWLAHRLHVG